MYPDGVTECACGAPIRRGESICDACWTWACEEMGVDPRTGLDKLGNDCHDDVLTYATLKVAHLEPGRPVSVFADTRYLVFDRTIYKDLVYQTFDGLELVLLVEIGPASVVQQ
jgi:hypothetical protein